MIAAAVAMSEAGGMLLLRLATMAALGGAVGVWAAVLWRPVGRFIARQEAYYDKVLRRSLLIDVNPRTVTLLAVGAVVLCALVGYSIVGHVLVAILGGAVGLFLPSVTLKLLRTLRLSKLEDQLVNGVQTLSSGVRAGLNLIQAMDLLAKNGVKPISEEFAHLLREYEYGVTLERAMLNAADRIGSSNYRLLFSALQTHRERGGNLGETLDRISDAIREIHRLEKRIETLTAPGRAAARWMSAMPAVILVILWFIYPEGVNMLFTDDLGRAFLLFIVLLNVIGFLWIRKIVNIDI
ncbi:MAG TPA: type II secretion system F family protein [Phycisphaerae bacterium]|nr:type II secretion system F family protein [Phycisphaerae bacterium]